jgi:hypothetical protein
MSISKMSISKTSIFEADSVSYDVTSMSRGYGFGAVDGLNLWVKSTR